MKTIVKLGLITTLILSALFFATCKHEIPLAGDEGNNNTDTCGNLPFTYSGAVASLMTTYCTRCHGATSPRAGIDLSTYDGVKAVALNGKLLGTIKKETGFKPMPPGNTKIPDCQIRQIENWVKAGSPNN
jgi:cytochrome c553